MINKKIFNLEWAIDVAVDGKEEDISSEILRKVQAQEFKSNDAL